MKAIAFRLLRFIMLFPVIRKNTSRGATLPEPVPMALYRSQWNWLLFLPVGCGLAYMAFVLTALSFAMTSNLKFVVMVLGLFAAAGALGCFRSVWKDFKDREPMVLIDADGMTDVRNGIGPVAWNQIEKVWDDTDGVCLHLKLFNGGVQGKVQSSVKSGLRKVLRQGDVSISLADLRVNYTRLSKAIRAYMDRSPPAASSLNTQEAS